VFGGAAASVACRRQRGDGYNGYAFVANEEGKAVAVVDLTAFAVSRHIRLDDAPTQIIAPAGGTSVYALASATGTLYEISTQTLAVKRKFNPAGPALSMRLSEDAKSLWVMSNASRRLAQVDLAAFHVSSHIRIPEPGVDFDIANYSGMAVVSHGAAKSLSIVNLDEKHVAATPRLGGEAGTVRFRQDGEMIILANPDQRMLTLLDARKGQIIVQLPLSLRPDNFCFNPNGGQLFITGEGRDAVAVVYPYWVPEVAETALAGSRPGAMATTAEHLFVTNPSAGDVSILSILRRKVIAVTAVGAEPSFVTLTPDGEYALVLNRRSGDMAVIRVAGLQPDRRKTAALFTMIPVGSKPVSAGVKSV
jgi:DNA-binding beta-propeller fold protein YncE